MLNYLSIKVTVATLELCAASVCVSQFTGSHVETQARVQTEFMSSYESWYDGVAIKKDGMGNILWNIIFEFHNIFNDLFHVNGKYMPVWPKK